jgi:hypothetical protein
MTLNITIFDAILLKNVGVSRFSVRFCRWSQVVFSYLYPKFPINSFESYTSAGIQTRPSPGTTIALFQCNLQDWLPGVAGTEPRLGSGFLGGQLRKGGLHQPPFSFLLGRLTGGWLVWEVRFPRVCHRSGSVQRAYPLGPSFSSRFSLLSSCRGGACPAQSAAHPSAGLYSKLSTCFVFASPPATRL